MVLTILHKESLRLILKGHISCSLHALITNKYIGEALPSFFGGGEVLDVRASPWTQWQFESCEERLH
jgi:hypothetical protein